MSGLGADPEKLPQPTKVERLPAEPPNKVQEDKAAISSEDCIVAAEEIKVGIISDSNIVVDTVNITPKFTQHNFPTQTSKAPPDLTTNSTLVEVFT